MSWTKQCVELQSRCEADMTTLAWFWVYFTAATICLCTTSIGEHKGFASTSILEERPLTSPEATQYYVDAGILVTFPSNTSVQWQQDVLNSLLFAQLAARNEYSRGNDPDGWFGYFQRVLENIGWVMTSTAFSVAVSDHDYFVFSSLALNQMMGNKRWHVEVETFRRFFNTLHDLPDNDTNIQLLYGTAYDKNSTNATNLILCSFGASSDNEVQLSLIMLGFEGVRNTTHAYVKRYLFYIYRAADVKFGKAKSLNMVLNEAIFRKVEPTILGKLGDRVKSMISRTQK